MDATESSKTGSSPASGGWDRGAVIEPLTRNGYKRLVEVERQIGEAAALDGPALAQQARQKDEAAPDFLSPEALVYFIRRAIVNDEVRIRDDLFRELLQRCNLHFRGKFRGFSRDDREDLQGEVRRMVIEDLFAEDDRGDFIQVRFWKYLERKCIDACVATSRQTENIVSLDTGYSGDSISEEFIKLDQEVDRQVLPEEFAMIMEGLEQLPPRLRHVFLLRHYVGMKIGPDNLDKSEGKELTIAEQFGRTGRTIRNWSKEADRLLAEFQAKRSRQE